MQWCHAEERGFRRNIFDFSGQKGADNRPVFLLFFFFVFVGLDFFPCIQQLIREDADRNTFERVQIYTV